MSSTPPKLTPEEIAFQDNIKHLESAPQAKETNFASRALAAAYSISLEPLYFNVVRPAGQGTWGAVKSAGLMTKNAGRMTMNAAQEQTTDRLLARKAVPHGTDEDRQAVREGLKQQRKQEKKKEEQESRGKNAKALAEGERTKNPALESVGLMAQQYAVIMSDRSEPGFNQGAVHNLLNNKKIRAEQEARQEMKGHLITNSSRLTSKFIKRFTTKAKAGEPEANPIHLYADAMKKEMLNVLPDYKHEARAPSGDQTAGLEAVKKLLSANQNKSEPAVTAVMNHFNSEMGELILVTSTAQFDGTDPKSIHKRLNKLRETTATDLDAVKTQQVASSNQLFDDAIALQKSPAVTDEAAQLALIVPKDTETETDRKVRLDEAKELIKNLTDAGELVSNKVSVTGTPADTTITGSSSTPTTLAPASDMVATLEALKSSEESRITAAIDKENLALNNKLTTMAEDHHRFLANSISSSYEISRLSPAQLKTAEQMITAELSEMSIAREGPDGALGALGGGLTAADVDMTKVLARVINARQPTAGLQGLQWDLQFKPADPKANPPSLKGEYILSFSSQNNYTKQQAIMQQASMIAKTSTSISFEASSTYKKAGRPRIDKDKTAQIAMMQAIAIYNTSGLDPEKATLNILIGHDKSGKEIFEKVKVSELENMQVMGKDNHVAFKMKDYIREPLKGNLSKAKTARADHDSQYVTSKPTEIFAQTKDKLNDVKTDADTATASNTATGGKKMTTT